MILLISTSLNLNSRSRRLARAAENSLKGQGQATDWLDLQEVPLPLCDAGPAYSAPGVAEVEARIKAADGIIMAVPIYNYYSNAASKNLVELTGEAWEDKIVGFLCAAGGQGSYMSIMSLANQLMLDFRCIVVPRFVYATGGDFGSDSITNPAVKQRIDQLCAEMVRFTTGLSKGRA